jgi:hypothetical protein
VISIGTCASSVAFILFVNLGARVYRSFKVISEFWNRPKEVNEAWMRATYYASAGFDDGDDLLGNIIRRGWKGTIAILVGSLVFANEEVSSVSCSGIS